MICRTKSTSSLSDQLMPPLPQLTSDKKRLALVGHLTTSPLPDLWEPLLRSARGPEADVTCCMVGLPKLLRAPSACGESSPCLFSSLVQADNHAIILSDTMRASIAFKWAAFGRSAWRRQLLRFGIDLFSFLGAVTLVSVTQHACVSCI